LVRILSLTFPHDESADPFEVHFAVGLWRASCDNPAGAQLLISRVTQRYEFLRRLFQYPILKALTAVRVTPLCQWLWEQFHTIDVQDLRAGLDLEFAGAAAEPPPPPQADPMYSFKRTGPHWQVRSPPQADPMYSFKRTGTHWQVRFGDERGMYDDDVNIQRVVRLLQHPDTALGALTLTGRNERFAGVPHTSQEASDREGKDAVVRRCRELAAEIEKAKAKGEEALANELRAEFEKLTQRAKADRGRGQRSRRIDGASPAERAKDTARKSLDRAYKTWHKGCPSS
jgi:hypothetical protein